MQMKARMAICLNKHVESIQHTQKINSKKYFRFWEQLHELVKPPASEINHTLTAALIKGRDTDWALSGWWLMKVAMTVCI